MYCAIIPKVKNNKGEIVDSKFFKDLLSYTPSRDVTTDIYFRTKSDEFINNWIPSLKIQLDDCNEPVFTDLLLKTNVIEKYDLEKHIIYKIRKDMGLLKPDKTLKLYDDKQYKSLVEKSKQFNIQSPLGKVFRAEPTKIEDRETHKLYWNIYFKPRKDDAKSYALDVSNVEYNKNLNDKLYAILEKAGVSVGFLRDNEQNKDIAGVTDFSVAKDLATGLIELIRLANDEKGQKALPEEFAHFVLEALGPNNTLVTRLLDVISKNNLVPEILGDEYKTYVEAYNNNTTKLEKEAAGKLLAKHLLRAEPLTNQPYKNILQRVIQFFNNMIKRIKVSDIQKAMLEADKQFGDVAKQILTGQLDNQISVDNISTSDYFLMTADRLERDEKLLNTLINNELKRLKIYQSRTGDTSFDVAQAELIESLEESLISKSYLQGVATFLESARNTLSNLDTRLNNINSSSHTVKEKASILRNVRNYIYSYSRMVEEINSVLVEEELKGDAADREWLKFKARVEECTTLTKTLFNKYEKIAYPLFLDFIKPFTSHKLVVPFGKYKGQEITIDEDFLKKASKDITMFDLWLDSMADSSDHMLRVLDQIVKTRKEEARLDTIDIMKELQAAAIELEQSGIKDTSWMFELDESGNKTGNYIQELNWGKYKQAEKEMYKNLEAKYGKNPKGEDIAKWHKERTEWFKNNREYKTINDATFSFPKQSIYGNKVFASLTPAQRKYYDTVIKIKEKLDSYLPDNYTNLHNAVKIRKDLIERIKSSSSIKDVGIQFVENIKDSFLQRSDDTEFGTKSTLIDFENKEVQVLPIYYTKLRPGENVNDISTDVTSTMSAYADMALNYREMSKVIDILEVGRTILHRRDIGQQAGDKILTEDFTILGHTIKTPLNKKGNQSNFGLRLDTFFDMQIYNKQSKDEGTFGNTQISKAKTANVLNMLTSLGSMALSATSAAANATVGNLMMQVEAASREFFTHKDLIKGDAQYFASLSSFLGEIGSRVHTSKLYLWNELFDITQDFDTHIKDIEFDRKKLSKLFSLNSLYFMSHAGEHWMHLRTSLAVANNTKMKDKQGKIVSLWEAMEVVYKDPNNHALGATLKVKEGYTKLDGSEFTKDDIRIFSRKVAAVNQSLHGVYNKADKNRIQHYALGRLAYMFRKWMRASYNKRFRQAIYNEDLKSWKEGYYLTSWRFIKQLGKDLRNLEFHMIRDFRNLTKHEQANIRRTLMEVFIFITLMGLRANLGDDDETPEENSWFYNMYDFLVRRSFTEIAALVPSPWMLSEGLRVVSTPAASITTLENTINLVQLLDFDNWGEEGIIESGPHKGKTKAQRLLEKAPIVPFYKTLRRNIYPEEAIPFYKLASF